MRKNRHPRHPQNPVFHETEVTELGAEALGVFLISFFLWANYLFLNSYAFWRPEALALFFLLSLPLWALSWILGKPKARWFFYFFLLALLLDMVFGIAEPFYRFAKNVFQAGKWPGYVFLVFTSLLFCYLAYLGRRSIRKLFLIGIAFSAASCLFLNLLFPISLYETRLFASPGPPNGKPNVYFFILDEHIGVQGIPRMDSDPGLAKDLKNYYTSMGFRVYGLAYSNYGSTLDSIPSLLNAEVHLKRQPQRKRMTLAANRLFEKFNREGYAIHVYQSTHPDYSKTPGLRIRKCLTYQSSSAGYLQSLPIGRREKLYAIATNLVGTYRSEPLKKILKWGLGGKKGNQDSMMGALATHTVLKEIEGDLRAHPTGTVYFAHLLMPHSSYLFDPNCRIRTPSAWEECIDRKPDEQGRVNTAESRSRKYALYAGQIRCLHTQLAAFFETLRASSLYEEGSLFLLSDHGSRIYLTAPAAEHASRMTREDYTDAFCAFLAVKNGGYNPVFPKNQGAYISEKTPSAAILGEFFGLISPDRPVDENLTKIYLQSGNSLDLKQLPMPELIRSVSGPDNSG